jgi:hypothetical protein
MLSAGRTPCLLQRGVVAAVVVLELESLQCNKVSRPTARIALGASKALLAPMKDRRSTEEQYHHKASSLLHMSTQRGRIYLESLGRSGRVLAAIKALEPGEEICYTKIAQKYGVDRSTLSRRHRG